MRPAAPASARTQRARWLGAAAVAFLVGGYYWLFLGAPRLLGSADPDRYYHLALARIYASSGLPRVLPQVEDLNWGHYFPDKEFLFHVLTGGAWAAGGDGAVLACVPLLGLAVALLLYFEASRVLRPAPAAALVGAGLLGTSAFLFRMSLLRPHLLAVLCFCLLLLAIVRQRPRLAALAAAAFVLSYHAFYVVGVVVVATWLLRRAEGMPRLTWAWVLGGLCLGLLVNPYFPSNLLMGVFTLKLALGLATLPAMEETLEVFQPSWRLVLVSYGFVLLCAAACTWPLLRRKLEPGVARTNFLFLLLVAGAFALLGMKSLRAMEYAVPAALLLAAHASALQVLGRHTLAALLAVLLACQGWVDLRVYRAHWSYPQMSFYPDYAPLLAQVPRGHSSKVFNCEWESGPIILHARPDLRFVDLLEPALLWQVSPQRYAARQGLVRGAFDDPHAILRGVFHADYVLCGARGAALVRQMQAMPGDFRAAPGTEGDPVRLFVLRPDDAASRASPK
jgi:hypothetical protein